MLTTGLGRNRLLRMFALASAVLLVGCGGGKTKSLTVGTSTTAPATSLAPATTLPPITSAPTTSPSTTALTGTRSSVSTSTIPSSADTMITRALIPEYTGSYEFGPSTINGVSYVNALAMYAQSSPTKVEINAGRVNTHFKGVLGVPDDQPSSSADLVEISFDNAAPALSVVVKFGESKSIDLDVTGVLRVRVTVSSQSGRSGYVAIGNPRFA